MVLQINVKKAGHYCVSFTNPVTTYNNLHFGVANTISSNCNIDNNFAGQLNSIVASGKTMYIHLKVNQVSSESAYVRVMLFAYTKNDNGTTTDVTSSVRNTVGSGFSVVSGGYIPPKLPRLSGTLSIYGKSTSYPYVTGNGVFSCSSTTSGYRITGESASTEKCDEIYFSTQGDSDIYSIYDRVQPFSINTLMCIKY